MTTAEIAKVIGGVIGELPPEARALIRRSIRWHVRPRPSPGDLELGAKPTDRGLFVGQPVRSEEDDEGGEFYADEGDELAEAQGLPGVYENEGEDVAEVDDARPGGAIAIYYANINPLTEATITEVVLHELGHFLGETEEGNEEMGLG